MNLRRQTPDQTHRKEYSHPDPSQIRLSIITPTMNRSTLARAAESVFSQLRETDEWLLIGDGVMPTIEDPRARCYATPKTGRMGNHQRDLGIWAASGDFLVFLDDDDILLPNALTIIREGIVLQPEIPHFFCIQCSWGVTMGREAKVCLHETAGAQFVPPNRKALLGQWESGTFLDTEFDFIARTLESFDGLHWFHTDKTTHLIEKSHFGAMA